MSNEYREGAKALLDLKKKDKSKRKNDGDSSNHKGKNENRDVEAAVLKYVAGTLDASGSKKRKKSFNNEDNENEFQNWNSFLETDQLQNGDEENPQDNNSRPETKKHKKSKKKKAIDVDPELANLDDTTDHEQLVRAAILDANRLARDAHVNIQDYIENNDQELDSSLIQAAEAAQQQQQEEGDHKQNGDKKIKHKDSIAEHGHGVENDHATPGAGINAEQEKSLAEAASKASSWVRNHTTGKIFTKEEIEAIDKFLVDFCAIHGLSRKELCERIWANERKREVLWDLLGQVLPNRTRASIYKHVRRSYHVFEVRGKWTPEDDAVLARLCVEKAKGWKAIGLEMGRMPEDCRDRFRNYIKCGDNRNLNKWSPEEEDKLKEIVNLFISEQQEAKMKSPIINWTIVSEKMGGKRSRIQCRYKWNKLLKREATQRAEKLGLDDRVWLLSKIQELGDLSQKEIEWEQLAAAHAKKYWTADDFKVAFNRMKGTVKDKKHKNLNEICHLLLQEAIQEAHRNNISVELPVVLQHFEESKPNDDGAPNAENIASAAINNSNRTTEDYVGWR